MRDYITVGTSGNDVSLPFRADTLAVINTTIYTLAVRVGSREHPANIAAATVYFPPATMLSIPVDAAEFGFSLVPPVLPEALPGMPDTAQVYFYQAELPPSFASAPVTSLLGTVAAETVVRSQPDRSGFTSYTDNNIPVPSGTRSLILDNLGLGIGEIDIFGGQSGHTYLSLQNLSPAAIAAQYKQVVTEFYASLDSTITVVVQDPGASGDNNYRIVASRNPYKPASFMPDGREYIKADVLPSSLSALPVSSVYPSDTGRASYAPLASRAASFNGAILPSQGARGLRVYINITALPGSFTVYLNANSFTGIQGILDLSPALGGAGQTGLYFLEWYPGDTAPVVAAVKYRASLPIPSQWWIGFQNNAAGNYTYAIDYELIP